MPRLQRKVINFIVAIRCPNIRHSRLQSNGCSIPRDLQTRECIAISLLKRHGTYLKSSTPVRPSPCMNKIRGDVRRSPPCKEHAEVIPVRDIQHQNRTINKKQQLTFRLKYRSAFSSPGNFTMIFLMPLPKAQQSRAQRIPLRRTMLLTPEPGTYADMIRASKSNQHHANRIKQMQVHPGSSHRPRMPRQANRLWGKLTVETPLEDQNSERASQIIPNLSIGRCRKQSVMSAATPQPESNW